MHTVDSLQIIIKETIDSIHFERPPSELYDPIHYALSQGGKRIRPLLTLMACDMFGGDVLQALNPAMGLEIFHNFTLLHDDIMDQSPIRRGKETVYQKWNSNIALLSGDTMFALAFGYLIRTDKEFLPAILQVFDQTAIEVCEGQQYDMNFETSKTVSIAEYMEMIRLKTAVLIGACLKIGAIIAKASSEDIELIYKFGLNLGIAFQLQDDILDIYSDVAKFGKRTGNDIVTNKKTYLYLKALELSDYENRNVLLEYFSGYKIEDSLKIENVTAIYNRLDIKNIAEKEMRKYYAKAESCMEAIHASAQKKKSLIGLAESLMRRES